MHLGFLELNHSIDKSYSFSELVFPEKNFRLLNVEIHQLRESYYLIRQYTIPILCRLKIVKNFLVDRKSSVLLENGRVKL